jgi:SAM-dependent methyltransferase
MSDQPSPDSSWVPPGFQLDRPSAARIYDYFLGGYHNFQIDRDIAEKFLAAYPDLTRSAFVNRSFLRRAAEYVVRQGVNQFLDLGSGIPTVGNLHEIVRRHNPEARVVYVDIDPVAIAHSKAILEGDGLSGVILADLAEAEAILRHPEVKMLLDFSKPVGLFGIAALHFVQDEDRLLRALQVFREALVPGSYIALNVWTTDDAPEETLTQEEMAKPMATPGKPRSREQVEIYFTGFELVEPGLVHSPLWRPEGPDDLMLDDPGRSLTWAGVGRRI